MTNERRSAADVRDLLADLVDRCRTGWDSWTSVSPLEWPRSMRWALGGGALLGAFTLTWSMWWLVGLPASTALKHDIAAAIAALDHAQAQANRLPQLSATLQSAEAEAVAWERLLPIVSDGSQEATWRGDLESMVARAGLVLETARPGALGSKLGIDTERAELQVKGPLAALLNFLAAIDRAPRHLAIERLHLQAPDMGVATTGSAQATLTATVAAYRWRPNTISAVVSEAASLPRLPEAPTSWQLPSTMIDVFQASLTGRAGQQVVALVAPDQRQISPVDPEAPVGAMRAGHQRVTFRRTGNGTTVDWEGPANPPEERTQTPVSVSLHGVETVTALKAFARLTGRSLVVGDSVAGRLEVEMADVAPATGFEVLIRAAGLGVRAVGGVDWVAPRAELLADEQTQLEAASKRETMQPLISRRFALNYPRALELREIIIGEKDRKTQRLLSSRGSLIADPRTNQLFVTDLPERLEALSAFIARIDVPVRQVLIEARIVEADDRFSESLGVSLAGHYARARGGAAANAASSREGGAKSGRGTAGDDSGRLAANGAGKGAADILESALPAAVLAGVAPPSLAITLFGRSATRFLQLELSALETSGRGRVVSRPRVVTADKVEAVIEQGTELPYQARSSRRSASTVQFRKATLRLEVTPLITPDGQVILDVDVRKDSVGHAVADGFAVDTRHVKTQVQVENGGTVAIGGIYQEERRNSRAQVPWLGDVPLIGTLFRNRSGEDRRTELLVFITPSVVPETGGVDASAVPAAPALTKGDGDLAPAHAGFRGNLGRPAPRPDVRVNDALTGHPRLTATSLEATRSARPTHIPVSSGIGTQISAIHAGKRNTCRIDGGGQDHGRTRRRATSRTAVL